MSRRAPIEESMEQSPYKFYLCSHEYFEKVIDIQPYIHNLGQTLVWFGFQTLSRHVSRTLPHYKLRRIYIYQPTVQNYTKVSRAGPSKVMLAGTC